MPDIQKYLEGKFALAGFSLQNETVVRFINEGKMVENPFQRNSGDKLVIGIEVNGVHKLVSPNARSMRELSTAWGTNTVKWVDKHARVTLEEKKVYGQIKKVAYFHPVNGSK